VFTFVTTFCVDICVQAEGKGCGGGKSEGGWGGEGCEVGDRGGGELIGSKVGGGRMRLLTSNAAQGVGRVIRQLLHICSMPRILTRRGDDFLS